MKRRRDKEKRRDRERKKEESKKRKCIRETQARRAQVGGRRRSAPGLALDGNPSRKPSPPTRFGSPLN